jgi:hypothetical protein
MKEPLERPRQRQYYSMKMDIQKIAWKGLDWIYLVQVRDK